MPRSIAFFDLDRTLLDINSGHLWLLEEFRNGRIRFRQAASAVWWLSRYALGDYNLDAAVERAALLYAGFPADEMEQIVTRWFDKHVKHRLRPGAREAIQRHRGAGDLVVLATTSSQFAAACARTAFDLDDAVSTSVSIVDGRLDGTIAASAFGRHKLARCEAFAHAKEVSLSDCTFYTDSASDLPLLERVGRPVVVHPDRRLRVIATTRGWPIQDWGISGS